MGNLFAGFVLGALVGAATALMLAPQPGPRLQGTLRQRWAEIMDEGQRAAAERRAELEAELSEVKSASRAATS
jgi:gas vesicle protein